jgi:predicted nucleotide-binding protein (sugar kinase/HSP70/actin superfamily)
MARATKSERLAIPNLGNYTIALASAVTSLGIEAWWSTSTNSRAMELGVKAAPESLCLPFKAHLGHFIEADDAGVENALMVNSVGTCRLRYYRGMIEQILRDMGRNIRIWGLGFDGFKPPLIRYFDPPLIPFLKAVRLALEKIKIIDSIEILTSATRAREITKGETSLLMDLCFAELADIKNIREARAYHKTIDDRFNKIIKDENRRPLKIGLIGEVSVLRDKLLNQNLEQTLGHMGVEITNFFLLGAELGNIFGFPFGHKKNTRKHLSKIAAPYLGCTVGGHALDSVAHTISCAQKEYDAMVHVCPQGCMPEISIRPVLRRISSDMDIPILYLSFDEHTSPVGVTTRLEAFIDILNSRKEVKLDKKRVNGIK